MKKHINDLRETIHVFTELLRAIIKRLREWVYWKTAPCWTAEDLRRAKEGARELKKLFEPWSDEEKDAIFERARQNTVTVDPWAYRGG